MDYLSDTSFLIDCWRNRGRGAAHDFMLRHGDAQVAIPWIAKGEFLRGAELAGHSAEVVAGFLDRFPVVWPDEETLLVYARTWAGLVRRKARIGVHDLWIAAAALAHGLPLLTRNAAEFECVADLRIVDYTRPGA